jgi:GDP-4-dehydro-6-deoxy-D-mannose reductase
LTTLITGINGFAGSHLADLLHASGESVHGTTFGSLCLPLPENTICHELDLRDREKTGELLSQIKPEKIYHIAGYAAVGQSFKEPGLVFDINCGGTLNLFAAILNAGIKTRVLVISSAEVYGKLPAEKLPPLEDFPYHPENPYAASKVATEMVALGMQAGAGDRLEVMIARPFNHIGPRQGSNFVCADFSKRIAKASDGGKIPVGNLDAIRDFSDVRDIVRGYRAIMEKSAPGEIYNLSSGFHISIRELLEKLISISGKNIEVEVDPALFRPIDVPVFYGAADKAKRNVGWEPQYDLDQTLKDAYSYYSRSSE